MLGAAFAALSAASFGLNNAMTRRGVLTASVGQALAIGVPIGIPMFLLFALAGGGLGAIPRFSEGAILVIVATGLVHFILGRYCNYRSVKAMGANLSGPVVQLSMVVALILAVTLLDESLTLLRLAGIALVLLGASLMRGTEAPAASAVTVGAVGGGRSVAAPPAPFQPHYAEGVLFGLLAACCYGVTPILIRMVVQGGALAESMAAALLSYCAATAVIALTMLWPGQLRHVLSIDPVPARWFLGSGIIATISQAFLYLGLAVAPVSVVMPILQLHLVFRYLFARLLNPQFEVFGNTMMLAIATSVTGAVTLSLDPDSLRVLPLPDALVALLRWRLL